MIPELKTLLAVARYGTFTSAGERIGLTQTAVSAQIKRLEDYFGVTIFDRVGRSAILNADGERILERAKVLITMFDNLALADEDHTAAPMRIGAIASVQATFLPHAIASFREEYPERRLHIQPGLSLQLFDALDAGELDLAITVEPSFGVPEPLSWIELHRENFVLAVPPTIHGDDWRELMRMAPFIRYDRGSYGGRIVDRFLNREGITPNESIEIDDLEAIWALVENGLGVAILPLTISHPTPAAGMRLLSIEPGGLQRRIGILHGRRLQAPALTFVGCLQKAVAEYGGI